MPARVQTNLGEPCHQLLQPRIAILNTGHNLLKAVVLAVRVLLKGIHDLGKLRLKVLNQVDSLVAVLPHGPVTVA